MGCTSGTAIEVEADHVEDDERVEQRLHRIVHQLHRRLPASAHPSDHACIAVEGRQSLSPQAAFLSFQPAFRACMLCDGGPSKPIHTGHLSTCLQRRPCAHNTSC